MYINDARTKWIPPSVAFAVPEYCDSSHAVRLKPWRMGECESDKPLGVSVHIGEYVVGFVHLAEALRWFQPEVLEALGLAEDDA